MILQRVKDVLEHKAPVKAKRSADWPAVRARFLEAHPTCAVCDGRQKLEVHHIRPFHERPELELASHNLITLCESKGHGLVCHLAIGHLGDYRQANPMAVRDAAFWHSRLRAAQKANIPSRDIASGSDSR